MPSTADAGATSKRTAAKLRKIKAQTAATPARAHRGDTEVRGHFRHHAVPGNEQRMRAIRKDGLPLWLRQLRRRSQRSCWTWERCLKRSRSKFLSPASNILILMCASTPNIQARNRVVAVKLEARLGKTHRPEFYGGGDGKYAPLETRPAAGALAAPARCGAPQARAVGAA